MRGLAKTVHDTGNTTNNIGRLCLSVKNKLRLADLEIMQAETSLEDISIKVKASGLEIIQVRDYINASFTTGINT